MEMTGEAIRAMTRDFNASYLDQDNLAARIDAGEPVIWVHAGYSDNYGCRIRAVIHLGVRDRDGHFIDGDPDMTVVHFTTPDGRLNPAEAARRVMRPRWNNVRVPVEYEAVRRPGTRIRDEASPAGKPARRARKAAA